MALVVVSDLSHRWSLSDGHPSQPDAVLLVPEAHRRLPSPDSVARGNSLVVQPSTSSAAAEVQLESRAGATAADRRSATQIAAKRSRDASQS